MIRDAGKSAAVFMEIEVPAVSAYYPVHTDVSLQRGASVSIITFSKNIELVCSEELSEYRNVSLGHKETE